MLSYDSGATHPPLLDASPAVESLRAFCSGHIAHYKIPVIDEFPMTVTGKIRKVELRERGEALLGDGG